MSLLVKSLRSLGLLPLLACGNAPPQALAPPQRVMNPPTTKQQVPAVTATPPRTRIAITADMPPALRDYIASADRACDRGVEPACEYNVKSYFEGADRACADAKPNECYGLAQMYRTGDSIDPDPARAVELHEKGCAQGDVRSCFEGGVMNDQGNGIPVNGTRALQLLGMGCEGKDLDSSARADGDHC